MTEPGDIRLSRFDISFLPAFSCHSDESMSHSYDCSNSLEGIDALNIP